MVVMLHAMHVLGQSPEDVAKAAQIGRLAITRRYLDPSGAVSVYKQLKWTPYTTNAYGYPCCCMVIGSLEPMIHRTVTCN